MITFCISKSRESDINQILDSIHSQNIPNSQILIDNTPTKLTVKKNRLVRHAYHDIVVIMHDYYKLLPGWYTSLCSIDSDWDILMCKIMNKDGERFRDWCIWDDPDFGNPWWQYEPWCSEGRLNLGQPKLAPYDYNKTMYMYVSGGFWIAKKKFMIDNKLDESLDWGQAEDVEWSLRVRNKWKYRLFDGQVQLTKQKDVILCS